MEMEDKVRQFLQEFEQRVQFCEGGGHPSEIDRDEAANIRRFDSLVC